MWGIGAIIMRLMSHDSKPNRPDYEKRGSISLAEEEPEWKGLAQKAYSKELVKLAKSCVAFEPAKRPTLRQLRRRVDRYTLGSLDQADGMRSGGKPTERTTLRYAPEEEKYKIHLAR